MRGLGLIQPACATDKLRTTSKIEDKRKIELTHEIVVLRANMYSCTFLMTFRRSFAHHLFVDFVEYSSNIEQALPRSP
jgi:hypothetical protein